MSIRKASVSIREDTDACSWAQKDLAKTNERVLAHRKGRGERREMRMPPPVPLTEGDKGGGGKSA